MFDFLNNNGVGGGHINLFWIIVSLIAFIMGILLIFKDKKEDAVFKPRLPNIYINYLHQITN